MGNKLLEFQTETLVHRFLGCSDRLRDTRRLSIDEDVYFERVRVTIVGMEKRESLLQ
ncbi:hypothetical protein L873DRAFT_1824036 [Choiromyces venosus 120613-1]|uniref:Uncharacterized protein n=1 Tax=Choiromyces venosus 120613-1 TaxID=1336337 RepID=A0A3N4IRI5_9PEZI|nr:hypothetical protein L873DRAFT_1824036 [Choiromyces venosus 120613-1]